MNLAGQIIEFIHSPNPVYESKLTQGLVEYKWDKLRKTGFSQVEDYCIAAFVAGGDGVDLPPRWPLAGGIPGKSIFIEFPQFERLGGFYADHGLSPYTEEEADELDADNKFRKAFELFKKAPEAFRSTTALIRSVQLLRSDEEEIDVSYSHPAIPFSIFVSMVGKASVVSDLRLCESILHESMHLKLTLIEEVLYLIAPGNEDLYHSPWRETDRPLRGVLHGLFVFRGVHDFYKEIVEYMKHDPAGTDFISARMQVIEQEIMAVKNFFDQPGLTKLGALLALKLIDLQC